VTGPRDFITDVKADNGYQRFSGSGDSILKTTGTIKQTKLYGGAGNDVFENFGLTYSPTQSTFVGDFNDGGDRISLVSTYVVGFDLYENQYFIETVCDIGPECPISQIKINRTVVSNNNTIQNNVNDLLINGSLIYKLNTVSLNDSYCTDPLLRDPSYLIIRY
jgi:hypothetical protein